jgi:hypothetical protein
LIENVERDREADTVGELWGSLSVNDHLGPRALVAAVLLFDRLVMPVPPDGDAAELARWSGRWDPYRQKRMIDILGVGADPDNLVVTIPWTDSKRETFGELSDAVRQPTGPGADERAETLRRLRFDAETLGQARPDGYHLTRAILTDERNFDRDNEYADQLPHALVEAVVPAYGSFADADAELGINPVVHPPAGQRLSPSWIVGWELLVPEDNDWSDEKALEQAAKLARTQDYRAERLGMRDWWRLQIMSGVPAHAALEDLLGRVERLNAVTRRDDRRTTTLRSFAVLGGLIAAGGSWCPPVALTGGLLAAASLTAEWVWPKGPAGAATALAPAAMFSDIRKQFGWA